MKFFSGFAVHIIKNFLKSYFSIIAEFFHHILAKARFSIFKLRSISELIWNFGNFHHFFWLCKEFCFHISHTQWGVWKFCSRQDWFIRNKPSNWRIKIYWHSTFIAERLNLEPSRVQTDEDLRWKKDEKSFL